MGSTKHILCHVKHDPSVVLSTATTAAMILFVIFHDYN